MVDYGGKNGELSKTYKICPHLYTAGLSKNRLVRGSWAYAHDKFFRLPIYTPDTPERSLFVGDDDPGTRLLVTGRVLNTQCQPIAGALLDFWHTDDAGNYDNEGFNFRGHQFADAEGNYHLETVLPGLYPERPIRHIHVKAQAPNGPILTTQMYFEGESGNEPAGLIMAMTDREDGTKVATFDFILDYAVAQAPTDLDQEVIKEPVSEEHKIYFPLINRG